MRSGAEYREALGDGRKVWVMGAGAVEEYVAWYDRHLDPEWQDILLTPADGGERTPWAFHVPRSTEDLVGMGRSFARTMFLSAGNITHDPAYGNLIALGVVTTVQAQNVSPEQIDNALAYRDGIAHTGRFITYCGGAPIIGQRLQPDPRDRVALKLVRETDAGVIIRGRLGMHTSPAFAEDVYVGSLSGLMIDGHAASFIIPVNATGVTTLCRQIAMRDDNRFVSPLSSRYDDEGRVHPRPGLGAGARDGVEGVKEHEQTIEYLVDLIVAVQTVRSSLVAAERDPDFTSAGYCFPDHRHLAPGGIALFKARQRISEILRILPGSSLVVAPADSDLAAPELAQGLEESFGGGGWSALQRSALLQMAWDHVSSALDGRESAFELHASGGMPNWRGWLRRNFRDYNQLANAVTAMLGLAMPEINLGNIPAMPIAPRRRTAPPAEGDKA